MKEYKKIIMGECKEYSDRNQTILNACKKTSCAANKGYICQYRVISLDEDGECTWFTKRIK